MMKNCEARMTRNSRMGMLPLDLKNSIMESSVLPGRRMAPIPIRDMTTMIIPETAIAHM